MSAQPPISPPPSPEPTTGFSIPMPQTGPLRQIGVRLLIAVGFIVAMTTVVYLGRAGYRDNFDETVTLLDSFYYSTVSLTTTGYGDITPVTPTARLVNTVVVTPLRMAFLVLLVGSTVEILATRTREQWQIARWRRKLRDHTIVVGFGTKGRSAVDTLLGGGIDKKKIIVVDPAAQAVAEANAMGIGAILGDATSANILRRAEAGSAKRIIVTAYRDDTAVLVTLSARHLNPKAQIIVAVRESENVELLRQSGADTVITSSESVGRILGLATVSPALGTVLDDLLTYGRGLEVAERAVLPREEGLSPRNLDDVVVAVVRGGEVYPYFDPTVSQLLRGDRVVVIRSAEELPWAPRLGATDFDQMQSLAGDEEHDDDETAGIRADRDDPDDDPDEDSADGEAGRDGPGESRRPDGSG